MRLVTFLMRGMSLEGYRDSGLLGRELALYRHLRDSGVRTSLVTYGQRDQRLGNDTAGVGVCCNRWRLRDAAYERWLTWQHALALSRANLIKADQMNGAEVAIWAARRWRKPVIARCGFMWHHIVEQREGVDSPRAKWVRTLTKRVFDDAQHVVVTTHAMAAESVEKFGVPERKLTVIPNYVDTDVFAPREGEKAIPGRICTIGRLHPEKNLAALGAALEGLEVEWDLIGSGPDEGALRAQASQLGLKVRFLGNMPHDRLPGIIRQSSLFVLCSHLEGHPKVLLEAMACGTPVLGTEVAGIRGVIDHGVNGWLCRPDIPSLREAIKGLLSDAPLRERLASRGRTDVLARYSLPVVAERELAVYERVAG